MDYKFPTIKKFGGKNFKLATLHKGVTKEVAEKTKNINKKEGNEIRLIEKYRKYAVYVKK